MELRIPVVYFSLLPNVIVISLITPLQSIIMTLVYTNFKQQKKFQIPVIPILIDISMRGVRTWKKEGEFGKLFRLINKQKNNGSLSQPVPGGRRRSSVGNGSRRSSRDHRRRSAASGGLDEDDADSNFGTLDFSDVYVDQHEKDLVAAITPLSLHSSASKRTLANTFLTALSPKASIFPLHCNSLGESTKSSQTSEGPRFVTPKTLPPISSSLNHLVSVNDILVDGTSDAAYDLKTNDTNFSVHDEKLFQFKCDELYECIKIKIFSR
jgi:hypothetical protein